MTKADVWKQQAAAALMLVALCGVILPVRAGSTAEHIVTLTVAPIHEIAVSGSATLHITTAAAGHAPLPATDAGTTYSLTSNQGSKKITAHIDTALPPGMALNLTATAPTGGSSAGKRTLTTSGQDVVSGVGQVADTRTLSYELTATVAAGVLAPTTRTVTLTITE